MVLVLSFEYVTEVLRGIKYASHFRPFFRAKPNIAAGLFEDFLYQGDAN